MKTIETKVWAAVAGSGVGASVSAFLLWILGVTVWGQSNAADKAVNAITAVPAPVAGLLTVAVTILGTFVSGYAAPHTTRAVDYSTPTTPVDATALPAVDGNLPTPAA
jgi:hypothetical protein